jgi:uncharacterized protein YcbX
MSSVVVRNISIFPIKSIDPAVVATARVLASGALEHDREFALFDERGNVINGKRESGIHRIRARFDLENFVVTLNETDTFHLVRDHAAIEHWFTSFLGRPVSMRRNTSVGFPDDLESPGPTIVGSATIHEVGTWFGITHPDETRLRFRANIELATSQPFWEDRLFAEPETLVRFQVGDVTVFGVNPCQRCAVPSRNPWTGTATADFQRTFADKRAAMLPSWAAISRFNHYYRLAVNTRIPASDAGKTIRAGDVVESG